MVVSEEQAGNYDPDQIDETDCPHCGGRRLTGITSFICGYCRGSCRVSKMKAGMYDPDEMDEVDCPHCGGRGMTGLSGDICAYCDGAQKITTAAAAEHNRDEIDEVDCPHCQGRGLTGLVDDYCSFCKGSQTVSRERQKITTLKRWTRSIALIAGAWHYRLGSAILQLLQRIANGFECKGRGIRP